MGVGVTAVLQSSTATGLMATSFTVSGLTALGPALAVMLGANVGTTSITQVLSCNIGAVAPPLILTAVLTFLAVKRLKRAFFIALPGLFGPSRCSSVTILIDSHECSFLTSRHHSNLFGIGRQ